MKQKLFPLCVALLALVLCNTPLFAHDFEVDGIYYNITSETDKTVAVTYQGNSYFENIGEYSGSVTIPESVTYSGSTYSVTSIEDWTFSYCSSLTSVEIPNSVTSIGEAAFRYCSSLTSVEIPNSVTSIGDYAFEHCSSLTSVEIPNSVTSIGDDAFSWCSSLTSVVIGNSVTSIGYCAFEHCDGLTSIAVAENNQTYDSRNNCNAIIETQTNTLIAGCSKTTIPNSVTSIGYRAFFGCSSLTSVEIPNSVTSIGPYAFSACSSLTSVEIPNSVTSIEGYAFSDCSSLTSVEIPNCVIYIGVGAFSGCSSLTSIAVAEDNQTYDSRNNCNAIIETQTNTLIAGCSETTIPNSVTSIGESAFKYCSSLTSVVIPNSVTSIGYGAFSDCDGLTSVEIPNSVTSIGDVAFLDCSSLTSVVIPNSVTSIGSDAFRDCSALTTATVGCSWKKKPLYDFGENVTVNATLHSYENGICTVCGENSLNFEVDGIYYKITSPTNKTVAVTYRGSNEYSYSNEYSGAVTIPEFVTYNGNTYNVTSIGGNAFDDCSNLTSVVIPNSVTSIGYRAFFGCSSLTSVVIPNSVTSIGYYAFEGCSSLISVVIPNSVTSIWDSAFRGCSSLTSVVIPNSVTSIGNSAFVGCSILTSVVIPNSVTSIGDYAFYGCSSLTSVEIPNSVTSIGNSAFSCCSSLTSVEIPNSVTSIGFSAFLDCSSLTSVEIPNSVTSIGDWTFYNCSSLTSVVIPNSVTSIGDEAFEFCSSLTAVEIPNSVTSIGDEAFEFCSSLTSVVIPNSVTSIGYRAFFGCSSLTSVVIPNSVISIGYEAFIACDRLTTVTVSCSWGTNPLYDFGSGVTVNATLHSYENGICKVCGDKEFPTITYIVDGVVYATIQQKAGETPTLPEPPTKEGYTFKGWKDLPEVMPDEDITVEAEFTINTYEITYVIDDAVFAKQSVTYGDKITPPTAPEKEGYTFSGWENLPTTMPAHDVTVTGTFTENSYTLTYVIDGEIFQTETMVFGATINPPTAPEKEGHTFSGWKNLPETMPAHDLVIHGTYSKQQYLLTFILDGKVLQQGDVEYGAVITTPSVPAKEGHTFAGWENLPATMPAHDVTVYGTYDKQEYLLRFIADGEVVQQRYVEYGAKIVPPAAPEKEGHAFDGWKDVPETMPARDLEIQGSYTKQKYLLSFVIDGKIVQQNMVEYGTSITPPQVEEKEGHTFSGWKNLPETMPAHDVTVTGDYEVNTYTVRIYLNGALYQTMAVDYGTVLDIPVPTVPEDMEFKGWTTEIPATMPAHDLDIYGTYDYPTSIASLQANQRVTIYSLNGLLICKDAQWQTVKDKLAAGMYIVNGKKIFVKTE